MTNNTNAPPVFTNDSETRSIAETVAAATVQTAANIGAVITASDDDNDALTYSLEGTHRNKFTIVSSTGQLQTKVGESYDYEADTSYSVTIKADDGNGGTDTVAVTINVTNNTTEKPLTPAAPTVAATPGSTTSLAVTWTAPTNTGRPDISGYDLQYRKGTSGSWTDGPQNVTGTSTNITGLDPNSAYQVQVLATNADGDSDWSSPGSGRTANNAPQFSSSSTTRTLDETVGDATVQTAADIGAAVTATDADNDTLEYTLEDTDKDKFTIDSGTGQIQTKVGESYDYETDTSYAVTVKASDGNGGSDTITVTINVTNNTTEKPLVPAAPTVTATSGSTTSLDVTWTAPSNTGRPDITSYDLQYRKGTTGAWTDGPQNQTGTSAPISGLDGNSLYQVQMRATNADGDSDWSNSGSGNTANSPPTFTNASTTRSFAETVGDTTVQTPADIGAVVTATDPDNDTLSYTLEGTDKDKFTIDSGTGQIQTKVGESYDYETDTSYAVRVKASDGTANDTISVTINITNATEKPLAPVAPTVTSTSGSTTSLDVTWTAPSNTGRPSITSYDLQYRKGTSGDWTDGPQNRSGTSANITGLDGNSAYQVQMRATNADGDSDWSSPGSGNTANSPPTFTNASATRSLDETVGNASVQTAANIGAVVTATDPDNDTLSYTLGGTDAGKFTIVSTSGQIRTKVGESYDYETDTSYAVTVKATDTGGGSAVITVTINVTNNTTEKPLAPPAPTVVATSEVTMSLECDLDGTVEHGSPGNYKLRPAIPQGHQRCLEQRSSKPDRHECEHYGA